MTDTPFSLDGELALITGGGTGLGLGMAQCFVQAGARVVLVGRREDPLKQACDELGDTTSFLVHDVTDVHAADKLAATIAARFDHVSILVNNAGVHLKKKAVETSIDEFETVMATHVTGAFALSRAILPSMIERKTGNILFVASMASLMGVPQVYAYTTAKTATLGMVRALAAEASPHGVRVNAIAPGWIATDMARKAFAGDPTRHEKVLGRTPLGRLGEPEEIGTAAVFLCSPAASFVTGAVLPVDGGASIGF